MSDRSCDINNSNDNSKAKGGTPAMTRARRLLGACDTLNVTDKAEKKMTKSQG